jgi:hypothetical protein
VNAQEAADILGVNRRRHGDLLEMLRALTLYPWLNTAEFGFGAAIAWLWMSCGKVGNPKHANRGTQIISNAVQRLGAPKSIVLVGRQHKDHQRVEHEGTACRRSPPAHW